MMKKVIIRCIMLYIFISHFIAFLLAPYSSRASQVFELKDVLLLVWGSIYVLSTFFMWGYFFYDWGIKEFKSNCVKKMWFWVILIGGVLYFIGPMLYYLIVYEWGKSDS